MPDQEPKNKNKNKGGRPKSQNKREHHIALRLNDAELEIMRNKQEQAAYKESGPFIRDLICSANLSPKKTEKRINQNFYVELSRIGNNLNQLVKHANSNANSSIAPSLLTSLHDLLLELRKEIN